MKDKYVLIDVYRKNVNSEIQIEVIEEFSKSEDAYNQLKEIKLKYPNHYPYVYKKEN